MASIKKMNQTIAKWLYGEGEITDEVNMLKDPYWILKVGDKEYLPFETDFHSNYNALMKAINKAMGAGQEMSWSDKEKNMFWFAVYPVREIMNKREGISRWKVKVGSYTCAFTQYGMGRMGHGNKFNHDFEKSSPILAMHYSLYRLITNGLEY